MDVSSVIRGGMDIQRERKIVSTELFETLIKFQGDETRMYRPNRAVAGLPMFDAWGDQQDEY